MVDTLGNIYNNMVSLDLELNKEFDKTTDIIQVGAVIVDVKNRVILDHFNSYVNSEKPLSPFIINLTGISQKQHDKGISLQQTYDKLKSWCLLYNATKMITWGSGDLECLKTQLHLEHPNWIFGRAAWDTKKLYQTYRLSNNLSIQSGLSKSMTRVGLQFQGRKHNAEHDAYNTARIFIKILELFQDKQGV